MMTVNQIQADIRKMERLIGERIPPDGPTRIVIEAAWVDLTAFWDDDGDCDLHIESVGPYAIGLRDVYKYFRRQEMTGWEKEHQLTSEMNCWKVWDLERVMAVLREKEDRRSDPDSEEPIVDGEELPKEVSTAEAARILGISKDTVLELKKAGLLEYRNTGSPDSCRPVYAFSLRSVLAVRTTYQRDIPPYNPPKAPHRHQVKEKRKYKNFTLLDD